MVVSPLVLAKVVVVHPEVVVVLMAEKQVVLEVKVDVEVSFDRPASREHQVSMDRLVDQ